MSLLCRLVDLKTERDPEDRSAPACPRNITGHTVAVRVHMDRSLSIATPWWRRLMYICLTLLVSFESSHFLPVDQTFASRPAIKHEEKRTCSHIVCKWSFESSQHNKRLIVQVQGKGRICVAHHVPRLDWLLVRRNPRE